MEAEAEPIVCSSYTHARRHPMVLGSLGGYALPFQLTLTQVAVGIVVVLGMAKTWWLWAAPLPPLLAYVLTIGLPVVAAFVSRAVRIEGRSPVRAAWGWLCLWTAPPGGRSDGRPVRERPPSNPAAWRAVVRGPGR